MDRIIEKKRWTPGRIAAIAGIVLLVILILWVFAFRDNRSRLYVEYNQLSIAAVEKSRFQEFIPVDGIVFPRNTVYIDAVQGGIVEEIFVEDGAILKQGDPILRLSNANMELSYMDQETRMYDAINNLANTRISLEQLKYVRQKEITQLNYEIDKLKTDFSRKEQFYRDKLISEKEYEDARRDYQYSLKQMEIALNLRRLDSISGVSQGKQISLSMERMNNNLALLKRNMDNMTIKSPVDGKLSAFLVEIGQTKTSGEHLGQIDMMDGIKLRANIDERYISRVFTGQEASCDLGNKTYELEISKIYTNVTGGTFQVDLLFTDEEPVEVKRGQTIQLKVKFSGASDALILRRGGFFQETGGNWIYVLDPSEEYAVKRNIRIGRQNTSHYEVLEGLEAGEKVIVSSYDNFNSREKLIFRK
ncbi:MAG: HlyD family efflux transporter periplasmic adaptor subunit [Lentimicrobium sp.]|jgi:HlyD family secretion protein|uniref:efflux RND transporter periplasmic adaptor subunit n=1 Tax=Lentimicrobium sp. TaxID=2034841 RepID=UPI0025D2AB3F|nr:HlyD family efflux transporter periplasmic adaptor subunit [Lentimicrobium sp.]MCO5258326.1 HlyD family efflux transporter periplasmic adaptor subunit [Lentimicrobium sp.]